MNTYELLIGAAGLFAGVVITWLLMRSFIASAREEGRAQVQAEHAASRERVRALEEERQVQHAALSDLRRQSDSWREALDAVRDERAQQAERAARVPVLEQHVAMLLQQQRADQTELRSLSVSDAERQQQLAAVSENLNTAQAYVARLEQELTNRSRALSEISESRATYEEKASRLPGVERDLRDLQESAATAGRQLGDLREQLGRAESDLLSERRERAVATKELADEKLARQHAEGTASQFRAELSEANATLEAERSRTSEQLALLNEAREELSNQFKALANDILEEKSKRFSEHNQVSMGQLVNPLKERMTEFKAKVEEIHAKDLEQQAALRAQLGQLKDLNRQMTEEAHGLAVALKGQSKMQGNWGELVLGNVLDRAGLCEGKDYRREVSFDTDQGRRRPDVVLSLPQNKHLVIDAKVSLNAYTRYVNADDPALRAQALREHVLAIGSRIQELADRSYFELPGLNTPEMVFMFIPIESAFVEALRADETLFQRAIEHNILVATPTTLLTSLNIVRQLWRFEEQNAHTAELAESAGKVYKKLNTFLGSMESVGKQLDRAKESYLQAMGQLVNGKGNLIQQARDFERLGVSVQSQLPQELVARAALELDHMPLVVLEQNAVQP